MTLKQFTNQNLKRDLITILAILGIVFLSFVSASAQTPQTHRAMNYNSYVFKSTPIHFNYVDTLIIGPKETIVIILRKNKKAKKYHFKNQSLIINSINALIDTQHENN